MDQCDRFVQLLSDRLDGPLSGEEERALEEHLAACPACRALGSQLAAIHTAFFDLEETAAPDNFTQTVMARIRAQERPEKKVVPLFRRPQVRALTGLAACVVLCVGVYQAGLLRGPAPKPAVYTVSSASGGQDGAQSEEPAADAPAVFAAGEPEIPEDASSQSKLASPQPEPRNDLYSPQSQGRADASEGGAPQVDQAEPPPEGAAASNGAEIAPYAFPSGYGFRSGSSGICYEVGDQTVNAILTLVQLPEGAEEVLGADVEWSLDEAGRGYCVVTGAQMEALMGLAEEQGQELTAAASNRIGAEELCALVLTGEETPTPSNSDLP